MLSEDNGTGEVEVSVMYEKKCDICGTPLKMSKENIYLVKDEKMTGKHIIYNAIDCEKCGCQTILKERKVRAEDE